MPRYPIGKKPNRDQQKIWLEAIRRNGVGLTEWEINFCRDMDRWLKGSTELNEEQIWKLEQIYARRTP